MAERKISQAVGRNESIVPCKGLNQNHDVQSDDHSMIIGSLALLLTLFTIVIAFLQYRQGFRSNRTDNGAVGRQDTFGSIELSELGETSVLLRYLVVRCADAVSRTRCRGSFSQRRSPSEFGSDR